MSDEIGRVRASRKIPHGPTSEAMLAELTVIYCAPGWRLVCVREDEQ